MRIELKRRRHRVPPRPLRVEPLEWRRLLAADLHGTSAAFDAPSTVGAAQAAEFDFSASGLPPQVQVPSAAGNVSTDLATLSLLDEIAAPTVANTSQPGQDLAPNDPLREGSYFGGGQIINHAYTNNVEQPQASAASETLPASGSPQQHTANFGPAAQNAHRNANPFHNGSASSPTSVQGDTTHTDNDNTQGTQERQGTGGTTGTPDPDDHSRSDGGSHGGDTAILHDTVLAARVDRVSPFTEAAGEAPFFATSGRQGNSSWSGQQHGERGALDPNMVDWYLAEPQAPALVGLTL